jgi:hypothetical protein
MLPSSCIYSRPSRISFAIVAIRSSSIPSWYLHWPHHAQNLVKKQIAEIHCNPKEVPIKGHAPVRFAHLARMISQSVPPEIQGMTSQRFDPCTNEQNRGKMFLCL